MNTPKPISMDKFFEMYGRVSLERDLIKEQIERLQQDANAAAAETNASQKEESDS